MWARLAIRDEVPTARGWEGAYRNPTEGWLRLVQQWPLCSSQQRSLGPAAWGLPWSPDSSLPRLSCARVSSISHGVDGRPEFSSRKTSWLLYFWTSEMWDSVPMVSERTVTLAPKHSLPSLFRGRQRCLAVHRLLCGMGLVLADRPLASPPGGRRLGSCRARFPPISPSAEQSCHGVAPTF